jgi:hypothetical protein
MAAGEKTPSMPASGAAQADVEVVGETEEVGGTEALGQPATQEGRDLADLSVLQAQLALGIAAGEDDPPRRMELRLLLGFTAITRTCR